MRLRFTNVPFSEPWSSTTNPPSRSISTAWLRDTVTSSRKISQSGERPMRVRSPTGLKLSPALPPPCAHDECRPFEPEVVVVRCSPTSSAEKVCVVSADASPFESSAPQREQ